MNKKLKERFVLSVAVAAIVIILLVSSAQIFMANFARGLTADVGLFVTELSRQSAAGIRVQVESDLSFLKAIATYIGQQEAYDPEQLMPYVRAEQQANTRFKRLGLATPQGVVYTTDGHQRDLSSYDYFQKALSGLANVSGGFEDFFDGEQINAYGVPVIQNGQIVGVLFGIVRHDVFAGILSRAGFEGQGQTGIADSGGAVVADAGRVFQNAGARNLLDFAFEEADTPAQISKNLAAGQAGFALYRQGGQSYYLGYAPIGINGWQVLMAVPAGVVTQGTGRAAAIAGFIWFGTILSIGLVFVAHSINQRRNMKEFEYAAYIDAMTGTANWQKFLHSAGPLYKSRGVLPYALVYFDIDGYRIISDLFGTEGANRLLKKVAAVVTRGMAPGDLLARYYRDNFVLLMQYRNRNAIRRELRRIVAELNKGVEEYEVVFSFGVYEIDDPDVPLQTMLDSADAARRKIKGVREKQYCFFDSEMQRLAVVEKRIECAMVDALEAEQFAVYFQPQYRLADESVVGAEALVRWQHPEYGFLSPGDFIPIFEKNGFVMRLDLYVFERVCRHLQQWLQAGLAAHPVSVNLSRLHLRSTQVVTDMCRIAECYQVPPSLLQIELTENILMTFNPTLERIIGAFHKAGFTIAMDDFGSGFSSLGLLGRVSFDVLKLDSAFFAEETASQKNRTIVASVVEMAKKLQVTTVSEGIETKEQIDFLRENGCDVIQGYYYARPMPAEEYVKLLRRA